jgi:hypothetical protein
VREPERIKVALFPARSVRTGREPLLSDADLLVQPFCAMRPRRREDRIPADLKVRLDRASDQKRDPYAPTRAKVIERGIELALQELKAKKAAKR